MYKLLSAHPSKFESELNKLIQEGFEKDGDPFFVYGMPYIYCMLKHPKRPATAPKKGGN